MTILAVPAFQDQKMKSSKGGGFSDGGVHAERLTLTSQAVELAPPKGVAYGGFNASGTPYMLSSVQAINFDAAIPVDVEEYFVREDGTQLKTGTTSLLANASTLDPTTADPTLNANAAQGCSPYLAAGGILAYPNKLRYKLAIASSQVALPTGRVLLHFDVLEYDLPKDQEET